MQNFKTEMSTVLCMSGEPGENMGGGWDGRLGRRD